LVGAAGCAALVFIVGSVAPQLASAPLFAFALAFACVAGEIVLLAVLGPRLRPVHALGVVGAAVVPIVLLAGAPAHAPQAAALTLVLGVGATVIGATLGARIERAGQLVAVALVSAIADCWSVLDPSAPSARFAEEVMAHPEQLALAALPFPLLGTTLVPAVIGAGDVVFSALYVAAFRAHGLSLRRVALALAAGYAVGLCGLLALERPLPLLPLLGAAVVLSEPAARSLPRREWRTVLAVCAALGLAIALRIAR
jgi:hypothetical protein